MYKNVYDYYMYLYYEYIKKCVIIYEIDLYIIVYNFFMYNYIKNYT